MRVFELQQVVSICPELKCLKGNWKIYTTNALKADEQHECIPVGCVPPASVAASGSEEGVCFWSGGGVCIPITPPGHPLSQPHHPPDTHPYQSAWIHTLPLPNFMLGYTSPLSPLPHMPSSLLHAGIHPFCEQNDIRV